MSGLFLCKGKHCYFSLPYCLTVGYCICIHARGKDYGYRPSNPPTACVFRQNVKWDWCLCHSTLCSKFRPQHDTVFWNPVFSRTVLSSTRIGKSRASVRCRAIKHCQLIPPTLEISRLNGSPNMKTKQQLKRKNFHFHYRFFQRK